MCDPFFYISYGRKPIRKGGFCLTINTFSNVYKYTIVYNKYKDMTAIIILLVLGAITSSIFIVSKVTNYSLKTIIFKTVASLFFLAVAIVAFCLTNNDHLVFKIFTLLGLIFGLLGDVFLGFKYITKGGIQKLFVLLGMFAFAFGHIFYIIALLVGFYIRGNALFIVLPFVLPILIITVYMFVAKRVGINFGKGMLPFGLFYLYCLTCMFSSALSMVILYKFSNTTLILFFIGAFNFVCSDFMLTGAYFKHGERSKTYRAVYSVFYYLAQFIIAFSIFFLV